MAAAALACAAALPARAQACGTRSTPASTLTAGQPVRGALAREDYTLPGDRYDGADPCTGRPYDSYFYEAQAGERLTFTLESAEIDPSITATSQWRGGGRNDVAERRGRRGRPLTVTGTVPATGRIKIQVESNVSMGRAGSFGAYTLTVRSDRAGSGGSAGAGGSGSSTGSGRTGGSAESATGATVLQAGTVVRGELRQGDSVLPDGSLHDDYTYRARRGERIAVRMDSNDFDAFLVVGRAGGHVELDDAVGDDDGGGGTNARVEFTADRDGVLTVRANSVRRGESGRYTLVLQSAPSGSASAGDDGNGGPTPAIRAGQTVRGTLTDGHPTLPDGSHYADYAYAGRRGERLTVRLSSDAFDAFLQVGAMAPGGGFESIVGDDDGGGGTNARVEYTAERDGPVLVRVNSVMPGETGAYTLALQSGRASARPAAPAPTLELRSEAQVRTSLPPSLAPSFALRSSPAPTPSRAMERARRSALSPRAQAWGMAALGVGMIVGGYHLEKTSLEPLGALIRYTGYAAVVLAPIGS